MTGWISLQSEGRSRVFSNTPAAGTFSPTQALPIPDPLHTGLQTSGASTSSPHSRDQTASEHFI